jgi:hypothetical protein
MKRAAGAIANRNRAGQIEGGTSATTCRCRERSPSVSPLRSRSALFACDHAEPEPRSEQNPWNHHSDEDQAGGEDSFPDRDNGEEVELSGVFAVRVTGGDGEEPGRYRKPECRQSPDDKADKEVRNPCTSRQRAEPPS